MSMARYMTKKIISAHSIREALIDMGRKLLKNFENAPSRIFKFSRQIIKDNDKILIKGYSFLVKNILSKAHQSGLKLSVFILENRPECEGYLMYEELVKEGINCTLLVDSAMGFIMDEIDYILTGAEIVTENGGIINRVGTYSLALCAKSLEKSFYVVAENFKFSRIFPLCQKDINEEVLQSKEFLFFGEKMTEKKRVKFKSPRCDFTPPDFISFIISDSKIFKPSSISDEMLQLFNL